MDKYYSIRAQWCERKRGDGVSHFKEHFRLNEMVTISTHNFEIIFLIVHSLLIRKRFLFLINFFLMDKNIIFSK